jgi:hypothetical protein
MYIFAIHVSLGEITALVLKDLAVQGQDLWEKANIYLFVKLIC